MRMLNQRLKTDLNSERALELISLIHFCELVQTVSNSFALIIFDIKDFHQVTSL